MKSNEVTHNNLPEAVGLIMEKILLIEAALGKAVAPQPPKPDLVTLREAREILRHTVTVGTIYNWHNQGRISATKVGRKLLFKRSDIEAILNNGKP